MISSSPRLTASWTMKVGSTMNRITISQVELGLHGGGASSRKAPLAAFFHIAVADTWQRRQIFRRMGASVAIEE
jgi:hypothetical protein